MSEEKTTGFATEEAGDGLRRITNIGTDPWQVKALQGSVRFKQRPALQIQPLDFNGYPNGPPFTTPRAELKLEPATIYYLVEATGADKAAGFE
jgi:hypothetical protein